MTPLHRGVWPICIAGRASVASNTASRLDARTADAPARQSTAAATTVESVLARRMGVADSDQFDPNPAPTPLKIGAYKNA